MVDTLTTTVTAVDSTGILINLAANPLLLTIVTAVLTAVLFLIVMYIIVKKVNSKKLQQFKYLIQIMLDAVSDGKISKAQLVEIFTNLQRMFITEPELTVQQINQTVLSKVHNIRKSKINAEKHNEKQK